LKRLVFLYTQAHVIIENKPPNTTAKEYTETLMKMMKDKDEEYHNKVLANRQNIYTAHIKTGATDFNLEL